MAWVFWACSLLGHAAFWAGFVNRVHALGMPRWFVKSVSLAGLLLIPLGALWWWEPLLRLLFSPFDIAQYRGQFPLRFGYALAVIPWAIWVAVNWAWRHALGDRWNYPHAHTKKIVDFGAARDTPLAIGLVAKLAQFWPGNETWRLQIEEHDFHPARLPPELAGFRIAHLSDFHFTGRVGRAYFERVVEAVAAQRPDLIVISGDLVDAADCLDWIPHTLGRLSAAHGVYYVLGNHDLRTRDLPRLHRLLADHNIWDVGGSWRVIQPRGCPVLLAGNELPWLGPAAALEHAPRIHENRPFFKILLSHTPDQFTYAQRWDFDLMFAGHTHGGQIALPLIGPIFAPSWHGVRFAGGTFANGPTIMHVSRGISSELPLRWNAPPELSLIRLQTAAALVTLDSLPLVAATAIQPG